MTSDDGTDPVAVAMSYLASFATCDPDAIAAHVSDDFVNDHASALGNGCRGREEYRSRLPGFLSGFVDLRYEPEQVLADGSFVAVRYRLRAVSNGRPVDIRGAMFFEIADGAISRRTDYWDSLEYMRQTARD